MDNTEKCTRAEEINLIDVAKCHGTVRPGIPPPRPGALDPRRLDRLAAFVEEHVGEHLTIDSLAAAVCLSKYHFARAFQVATGSSPMRFLKEKRLEMARRMLSAEACTLTDIAVRCRLSSPANFSRVFRNATGLTPSQYRATFSTVAATIRRYLADRVE
jgi:AraC family transcriptional regulator